MALSAAQLAAYREQGFLAIEGLIPADRVDGMRRRMVALAAHVDSAEARRVGAQLERSAGATGTAVAPADAVRKFDNLTRHEQVFLEHARFPALVDVVAELIGAPVSLYVDQAMLKPPHYGTEKPPHQDNAYFKIDPADAGVTAWCALDDASLENGCMEYIAGSHRLGLLRHGGIAGTPHLVPEDPLGAFVPVPVPAGSVVFHHYLTLHRSKANHSDTWRRAFICHYVRTDANMPQRRPDAPPLLQVR